MHHLPRHQARVGGRVPVRGQLVGTKEAHDYRYFPEPDLVPLAPPAEWIQEMRRSLPELPEARRARFVAQYGPPEYDARVLTDTKARADYFEAVLRQGAEPKQAGNWVKDELLGLLNKEGKGIEQSSVPPKRLGELLKLLAEGTIIGKIAKAVFEEMYATGKAPADIVREKGLVVIADAGALEGIIQDVLARHPAAVTKFKAGKAGSKNFLVGQVMKATQGKADPKLVNDLLAKKLAS